MKRISNEIRYGVWLLARLGHKPAEIHRIMRREVGVQISERSVYNIYSERGLM